MGKSVSSINVLVSSSAKAYVRGLDTAIKQTKSKGIEWKRAMTNVARGVGLALLGVAVAGAKMAMDFEKSMTKMQTLVGLSRKTVTSFSKEVLALSMKTGRSAVELSDALFVITSAGMRGSEAIDVLGQSAKAASIGLGEARDIARALTGVLQAYSKEGLTAARATEILLATVEQGNLSAAELAPTLGRVVALAAQLGVSFEEVGANIATFTRLGVNSDEAVTGLRQVLASLIKPTNEAKEAFAEFVEGGLDEVKRAIKDRGLHQVLVDLVEITEGNDEALSKMFGNIRALATVLGTASAQGRTYLDVFGKIESQNERLNRGFGIVSETMDQQLTVALNRLKIRSQQVTTPFALAFASFLDGSLNLGVARAAIAFGVLRSQLKGLADTAKEPAVIALFDGLLLTPTPKKQKGLPPSEGKGKGKGEDDTSVVVVTENTESLTEKISRLNKELLEQAISGDISTTKLEELKEATFALKVAQDDLAYSIKNSSDIMGRSYETLPYMAGEGMELVSDEELDKLDKVDTKLKGISANMINLQNKYGEAFQFAAEALGQLTTIHATSMANQMAALTARQEKDRAEIALTLGKTKGAKDALMELDKKHAKERAKQASKTAKQQKILGIIQATINTAIGVTKALSNKDFIAAAVIAGLGAAQVAVIASQYIPSFRFGTPYHFGGLAEINEGPSGGEIVNMPRGSSVTSTFDQMGGGKELMLKLDPHEIILYLQDQGAMFNYRTG